MSEYLLNECSEVEERAAWPGVVSLALGVFGFITAELLPASLLTAMEKGLDMSEAIAGQAVSATSIVALFAALLAKCRLFSIEFVACFSLLPPGRLNRK